MANDELDALNALEKEAKEYDKVRFDWITPSFRELAVADSVLKDAEIDRIIKAFRLDA